MTDARRDSREFRAPSGSLGAGSAARRAPHVALHGARRRFGPVSFAVLAGGVVAALLAATSPALAQETASLVFRGQSHPVAVSGGDFRVADVARPLGFESVADPATGALTLTGHGHRVVLGAGTSQVPVDQKVVSIGRPARSINGELFAPAEFFEKVLFPLAGASGAYDSARRLWSLAAGSGLAIEVAVVHVAPTTQVVLRQSFAARFVPALTETGLQIRWPDQTVVAPFSEHRYADPLVSAVRFAGSTATIDFAVPGSTARAYPLTAPDRLVIEVSRPAAGGAAPPPPVPTAPSPAGLTLVIDPGHGGGETGAIGAGGLQEKDATLAIARRIAAALPRLLFCRVVLTREADSAISLDDRTSVANHEKADLFLSVHANSARIPGAHGSETYYLSLEASDRLAQEAASRENQAAATPGAAPPTSPDLDFILWDLAQSAHLKESSELAEAIQEELNVVSGTQNRGIKQAPFRVLVGATMPAVLVETAFISNPDEEKRLASAAFQQKVADGIARAVARFFSKRRPGALLVPLPTPTAAPAR